MTRRRKLTLLLLPLVLLLPALWPLFNAPFFSSHDGMMHLWRLWEFDRLWSQGLFIGRWAPDFHFAFGSPIFTFYNPLPYIIGEFFIGWGLATHNAIKLILALSIILSFAGMFLVGREWFPGSHRNRAGLLAATLYTYTPYVINDVYTRLALGECLALGLMPFLIWSLIRFRNKGDSWALPLISLLGALLILTHSLTVMLWAPFLAIFVLLPTSSAIQRTKRWQAALLNQAKIHIRVLGALVLGVLMAAFFLDPMLNGLENIQLENAVAPHGEELFQVRLVSPLSYLQLNLVHDYSQDFFPSPNLPEHNPHFGLVITFFVLMGIIWLLRKKGGLSTRNTWLLATLVGCIYLLSPFSRDVWSYLPGLATVQFPWRLLIIISFVSSLLGASIATSPWLQKNLVFLSTLVIIVVAGIGGLSVNTIDWQSQWTNAANVTPYERQTNNIGMTSNAEFIPRWVAASLESLPWVHGDNSGGNEQDGLPDIALLEAEPLTYKFAIRNSADFPLTLDQFYFPSWEATLDENPVETYPAGQVGLLTVDVPPGSHELIVTNELIPATAAASLLSIGAWLIWITASFWLVGTKKLRLIMAGGLAFAALMAAPSLSRALGDQVPHAYTAVSTGDERLADNIRLLGYRIDTGDWMTSGLLGVELFLHVVDPIDEGGTIRVRIIKELDGGLPLVDSEHLLSQGFRPIEAWGQGQILRDRFFIRMPDRYSGEELRLEVGILGGTPKPVGPLIIPVRDFDLSEVNPIVPEQPKDIVFGDKLILRQAPLPGLENAFQESNQFSLPLFWSGTPQTTGRFFAVASLENQQGVTFITSSVAMNVQEHTWNWGTNHLFLTAQELPPGRYWIRLRVYSENGELLSAIMGEGENVDSPIDLGMIDYGMDRTCPQSKSYFTRASFESKIRLVSAGLNSSDDHVDLTLCWQALQTIATDFHVSVQLLDSGGKRVGQWDGHPRGGYAETSTWPVGAIVPDSYRFDLPDEGAPFHFKIGLYELERISQEEYRITRVLNAPGGLPAFTLGPFDQNFNAPDLPDDLIPVNADFEDGISLVGYAVQNREIVLYWKAEGHPSRDYTVFFHVLDAGGTIIAQNDGPPASGNRPTSSWYPDLIVQDPRSFDQSPTSAYEIRIGLYHLASGERLLLLTGEDEVIISSRGTLP